MRRVKGRTIRADSSTASIGCHPDIAGRATLTCLARKTLLGHTHRKVGLGHPRFKAHQPYKPGFQASEVAPKAAGHAWMANVLGVFRRRGSRLRVTGVATTWADRDCYLIPVDFTRESLALIPDRSLSWAEWRASSSHCPHKTASRTRKIALKVSECQVSSLSWGHPDATAKQL